MNLQILARVLSEWDIVLGPVASQVRPILRVFRQNVLLQPTLEEVDDMKPS
jgi:hypothetical protein